MRIAVVLLAVVPFCLNARSQEVPKNDDQAPAWRFQLPPAGSLSEDTRTPTEIKSEDDYFDSCCGASDPLVGPQRMGIGRSGPAMFDEDFPARFRDEVVVAHFTTWSTHLSSSGRSIYTIINLQIDRIVADKGGHMTEGSGIPLGVPGGTVPIPQSLFITPSSSVLGSPPVTHPPALRYFIRGKDFPLEPNVKYLIFLSQPLTLPFYGYGKAWNVDKGVLQPATQFDAYRISQGRSSHAGKSLESAINELKAR